MIVDFDEIKRIVHDVVLTPLDHRTLNDIIDNPTAERIAMWIWKRIDPVLAGLDEVVLWETANSCAVLRRSDIPRTGTGR